MAETARNAPHKGESISIRNSSLKFLPTRAVACLQAAAFLLLAGTWSQVLASSGDDICKSVLIKDKDYYNQNDNLRLSMASTIQKTDLHDAGVDAAGQAIVYGVPWSGQLNEWDKSQSNYFSQFKFDFDKSDSWTYVSNHLSPSTAQAFINCLKIKNPRDFYATVKHIDNASVVVSIDTYIKGFTFNKPYSLDVSAYNGSHKFWSHEQPIGVNDEIQTPPIPRTSTIDMKVQVSIRQENYQIRYSYDSA